MHNDYLTAEERAARHMLTITALFTVVSLKKPV